jgi:hypothetical protein
MSNYYPPQGTQDMDAGILDPGRSLAQGNTGHRLTGVEIGVIVATIIVFVLILVTIFFCRQREARRKAALALAAIDPAREATKSDAASAASSQTVPVNLQMPANLEPAKRPWAMPSFGRKTRDLHVEDRSKLCLAVQYIREN